MRALNLDRYFSRAHRPGEGPSVRGCDAPGCDCKGEHRAPKAPDRLNEYYWFCLEHVKVYNSGWDYFEGRQEAVESELRRAATWDRPTWPMGSGFDPQKLREAAFRAYATDHDGTYQTRFTAEDAKREAAGAALTPEARRAMEKLDLPLESDFPAIRARYIELVKRHHPDANGGDLKSEDRLKAINAAYRVLRLAFGEQPG